MMTCSLDFVDSIDAAPTVRLALADGNTWILNRNETDFSPPPLRQATSQTLLADGGVVPSSAYDFRRIILGLFLQTDTADDTAAALQSLYQELDRPEGNLLRWHEHTTNPVFFRTFRASASSVRRLGSADGRRKRIEVELLAEPFGYGLREDPVVDAVVSADPAAGSNGCFVDVSGVKGDVETPALIKWPESVGNLARQSLLAARRRGTPSQAPFLFQVESMTQGDDTTVQANDINFSGAGSNYSQCTFATNTDMATRVEMTSLGTASPDLRGTYRVLARFRKGTSGDSINLQLRWGDSDFDDFIDNVEYTAPPGTNFFMADLGLISVPFGNDPVHDLRSGVVLAVDDGLALQVRAARTSGSGTLDLDYIVLVPADDRLGIINWVNINQASDHRWLDAHDNSVHARSASDAVVSTEAPGMVGAFPMLSPGETNRIYVLYDVARSFSYLISTNITVSVSYYPRYLSVRPAST